MSELINSNKPMYRCLRTIIQGIIGVVMAQLPALITGVPLDPTWQALIVALTMAVLSPIMAMLGGDEGDSPIEVDE